MEQQDILQHSGLSIRMKENIKTAAIWARITAIISFISSALTLISRLSRGGLDSAFIGLAISVALNIFLFKFAHNMLRSLEDANQTEANLGWQNLKVYFQFYSILLIIVLGIVLIALLFGFRYFMAFLGGMR